MALNWSGAHVRVRYENEVPEDERDCPGDTIVIVMRPGQESDPSFVRAVRDVVTLRTFDYQCGISGPGSAPEPERAASEGEKDGAPDAPREDGDREALEAERRFVEAFLGDEGALPGEDRLGPAGGWDDLGLSLDDLLGDGCAGCGDWARRRTVQLVIGHCDEVVVGG